MEAATARVTTLMTNAEKQDLARRAKKAGTTTSDYVRSAIKDYAPGTPRQIAQLEQLATILQSAAESAHIAVDAANEAVAKTLADLKARNPA